MTMVVTLDRGTARVPRGAAARSRPSHRDPVLPLAVLNAVA